MHMLVIYKYVHTCKCIAAFKFPNFTWTDYMHIYMYMITVEKN